MDAFDRLTSSPILDGPKRQHYVSKFYLNGFAEHRRLAVFDRSDGAVNSVSPKKTTVAENFYTFVDEQDRSRFDLEELFGIIESRAGAPLKVAVSRRPLTFEDREHLAIFIAMTAVRTPAAFEESRSVREKVERALLKHDISSEDGAYKFLMRNKPAEPEARLREQAKRVFEMVNEDRFRINVPDEAARQSSLKRWHTVAETILERDWTIVHAAGNDIEYITSDSPVVVVPRVGTENLPLGFGTAHASVLFPLSRTAALVVDGQKGGRIRHSVARPEHVSNFNTAVAADCYRFVIASRERLVRQVVAPLNLCATQWAPKVDAGIGPMPDDGSPGVWIKGLGRRPMLPI